MQYWLLTTEYPPFFGGGISTYCYYTTRMLAENGHQVTVFVPDISVSTDIISESDNIRVIRFATNKTGRENQLGYTAFISYEFAHTVGQYLLTETKPDIIEVQDYQGIGYYLHLFRLFGYNQFKNLNILTTLHVTALVCMRFNREPIYKLPTFWMGEMEKFSILASDLVISPTRYILDKLAVDFRLTDKQVDIVPNPIAAAEQKGKPSFQRNEIIFLGKMVYLKGGFQLIEFFKSLWDKGFEHSLKIIGDTDFILHNEGVIARDLIKKKYGRYIDAGKLKLLGKLPAETIRTELSSAHVVITPSLFDNLPYTVLEAMLQNRVVLASKQGGHTEVIEDGKDGFLFDHLQPETFFEKLNTILSLTDEEVHTIGERARKKISDRYNYDIIHHQKMQVIERYMQQPKKERKIFPFIRPLPTSIPDVQLPGPNGRKDLLSVVIPYYNLGNLVSETIASVYGSTFQNLEVLVVNDGSTDENSVKALELIAQKYPQVKILHKKNGGLSDTRNYGASQASGEYLAFLDADDTVEPSYYEKAIRVLKQYDNIHFVGCWVKNFGNSDAIWPSFMPEPPYFLIHNTMNSSALVFKKASFLQAGNDTRMDSLEDWECIIHMSAKGLGGASLPEQLFNYRIREGSMFRNLTPARTQYLHTYIAEKHREFYGRYGTEIAGILKSSTANALSLDNPTIEAPGASRFLSGKLYMKLANIARKNYYLKKFALSVKRIIG